MDESTLRSAIAGALGPSAAVLGGGAIGAAARQVLSRLGPFPLGSPSAMHAVAAQFRVIAAANRAQGDRVVAGLGRAAAWSGGAQRRMHATLDAARAGTYRDAAELEHAANQLDAEAAALAQRQGEWDRRLQTLRNDAVHVLGVAARARLHGV